MDDAVKEYVSMTMYQRTQWKNIHSRVEIQKSMSSKLEFDDCSFDRPLQLVFLYRCIIVLLAYFCRVGSSCHSSIDDYLGGRTMPSPAVVQEKRANLEQISFCLGLLMGRQESQLRRGIPIELKGSWEGGRIGFLRKGQHRPLTVG